MRKRTNRHSSVSTLTPVSTRESSCSKVSVFDVAPPAPTKQPPFDASFSDHPVFRSPLAIVMNEGNQVRKPAKMAEVKRPSKKYGIVGTENLWKLLPSPPPTRTRLSFSKYDSSPTLEWLYNSKPVSALSRSSRAGQKRMYPCGEKRTQVLEWACARMEKRRKLCEDHPIQDESSDSDSTEDLYSDHGSPPRSSRSRSNNSKTKNVSGTPQVCIPPEYRALFSPDIILGASLLLTFKHSVGNEL